MTDDAECLTDVATGAEGATPTVGEVLAMNELLQRGIKDAEENDEFDLADLGRDFFTHYANVDITLHQQVTFERAVMEE